MKIKLESLIGNKMKFIMMIIKVIIIFIINTKITISFIKITQFNKVIIFLIKFAIVINKN